jgi:hypothetical protein
MQYNKRILKISSGTTRSSLLEKIAGFKDEIVVNLATSPEDAGILFSPENLQSLLANNINELHIDTVNQTDYCSLMKQQVSQLLTSTADLRQKLRNCYCCDLSNEFSVFLSFLQNVCMMLECLTINKSYSSLQPQLLKLQQAEEQLSECCFFLEDVSLCLDILRYEVDVSLMHLLGSLQRTKT